MALPLTVNDRSGAIYWFTLAVLLRIPVAAENEELAKRSSLAKEMNLDVRNQVTATILIVVIITRRSVIRIIPERCPWVVEVGTFTYAHARQPSAVSLFSKRASKVCVKSFIRTSISGGFKLTVLNRVATAAIFTLAIVCLVFEESNIGFGIVDIFHVAV